jgi:hypothetical protein
MNWIIRIASTLSIIASLLFLALPVSAATSTFGLDGGTHTYPEVANHLQAQRFQNTAGTGSLNKLELEFNQASGSGNVRLGVYADNNGVPGNILLDAGQIAAASGWVSISGLNLSVTANTYYWLAYNLQSGNTVEYQEGQIANTHVWGSASYGTLPSSFPTISYSGSNWYVMRATVSTSSPTPVPAKQWDKTFGGSGNDAGYAVIQANDGGFVIAGSTTSYGAGGTDAWLIKTDSNGNKLWDKTFGGAGNDVARSVARTFDGGYILGGYTNSYGAGNYDFWLIKTDSNGSKIWDKTFGGSGDDERESVTQATDGGYVIVGYSYSLGSEGICTTWLIKTDSGGNKLWDKTYSGPRYTKGLSVIQSTDGGYVLTENDDTGIDGLTKAIKTDNSGNIQWTTIVSSRTIFESIFRAVDGTYIIPGFKNITVGSPWGNQLFLSKLDNSGNIIWSKESLSDIYTNIYFYQGASVIQDYDGGYVIAGSVVNRLGTSGKDYRLIKTDSNGNLLWDKSFDGLQDDIASSIILTSDGSYVIAGTTSSYGAGGSDIWLVKVGQVSSPPTAPIPISPPDGANISGTSITFQWNASVGATNYWLSVNKADGSIFMNKPLDNITSTIVSGFPNDGTQYVWMIAAGNNAGWSSPSAIRKFTNGTSTLLPPAPPIVISPVDGAMVSGNSVTFQWSPSSGATNYWLAVFKADGSVIINKALGNVTSDMETGFPNNGTQYIWTVAAGNTAGWSIGATWKHFTNGTLSPPPPPNLISPADGAVVNGTSVTFQWSASSGATNYWLAVFKNDGSSVINKSLGNVTSTTEVGFPNNGTQYIWTVAAGNTAGWSTGATWKHFTNGTTYPPPPPILNSPADGAVVSGTSVTFQWSTSSGATNYWLAVRKVSDGSTIINKAVGNVIADTETGFLSNGTEYVWTAASGNSAGWSIGATWKRFYKVP